MSYPHPVKHHFHIIWRSSSYFCPSKGLTLAFPPKRTLRLNPVRLLQSQITSSPRLKGARAGQSPVHERLRWMAGCPTGGVGLCIVRCTEAEGCCVLPPMHRPLPASRTGTAAEQIDAEGEVPTGNTVAVMPPECSQENDNVDKKFNS